MTTIWFFQAGDSMHGTGMGESQWPSVPRIGDTVFFEENASAMFRVTDVLWHQRKDINGGVVARVQLEPRGNTVPPPSHVMPMRVGGN
jgi:hypothetical protein